MAIEQQYELLFGGRTLLVTTTIYTIVDLKILAERVRVACAGPHLRMVLGTITVLPGGYQFKSFVNTDETEAALAERVALLHPKPSLITVGIVSDRDAKKLWAEFHKIPHTQEAS